MKSILFLTLSILVLMVFFTACNNPFDGHIDDNTVAKPVFHPAGGMYASALEVEINTYTDEALIKYTTDGTAPSSTNGTLYNTPIAVSSTTTIRAYAFKEGMTDSEIADATYTFNRVADPVLTPAGGNYNRVPLYLEIDCGTPGATIRYTTDTTDPTPLYGTVYSDPIEMTGEPCTIKAIAYRTGFQDSGIIVGNYNFNISIVGHYDCHVYHVDAFGDYVYINNGDVIEILDITIPTSPTLIASYTYPSHPTKWAHDFFVDGDYLFVGIEYGNYYGGLDIFNISDPYHPMLITEFVYDGSSHSGSAETIFVFGNYAYIADLIKGLVVIDISDLNDPELVAELETPTLTHNLVIDQNYAYVMGYPNGLYIINISDPTDPTLISYYETPGEALSVVVAENKAYLADGYEGLHIVDITDKGNPVLLGTYDTDNSSGYIKRLAISGSYIYCATYATGLQVVDISDLANPLFYASYKDGDCVEDVAFISNGYIYVAESWGGLTVIEIQ
jgi:hypothetical protein